MATRPLAVPAGALLAAAAAHAQNLAVFSTSPTPNAMVAASTSIVLEFDRPLDPATVVPANLWAFGRSGGTVVAPLVLSNGNRTVTINPPDDFFPGELVTIYISRSLRAADGQFMRPAGYSFQFFAAAGSAGTFWRHVETMTTRTIPQQITRSYGGTATDLDGDGWLDLTIVNEISEDLRVFMNRDDGSGRFFPFSQPTFPIGTQGSPNEAADFNRDGLIDIAVSCGVSNDVSVLLGDGAGGYGPQQSIPINTEPRGIAVLDVDGDADQDIVVANAGSSNLVRLLNDGSGVFGSPLYWEGGGFGEWALGAADMTSDGVLDIVVGCVGNERYIVHRGNGDGTFTMLPFQNAGGPAWQVALADLDADGDVDVASANGSGGTGSILFGNGAGGLSAPIVHTVQGGTVASDLADLDGDGDFDWMISCFAGDWFLFRNNGAGVFQLWDTFPPSEAASCVIAYDSDNDGDLDLALIDELADEVVLYENTCYPDCNTSSTLTIADFACFQGAFASGNLYADCNGSGSLTIADFACFQAAFAKGCP